MLHVISLGLVLFAVWLLLSGYFLPLLIGLGIASVIVVIIFARRMDVIDHEGHPIHMSWRGITYFPWLIMEIIKANIDVARIIINPRLPISPTVIDLKGSQLSEVGNVVYANSITLTPGTVTIALENNKFTVHGLTRAATDELKGGEMDRRVTAMEGMKAGPEATK